MAQIVSRRPVVQAVAGVAVGSMFAARSSAGAEPIVVEAGGSDLPQPAILDWVRRCTRAVSTYLGKFPVSRARVQILLSDSARGVEDGMS